MDDFPFDWESPKWNLVDRVHNWRNYASKDLIEIWDHFTPHLKKVISALLNDIASQEAWD